MSKIKNFLKLITITFIGSALYILLFQVLATFFAVDVKPEIAWGISVYYGYFIFAILLFTSVLAIKIKTKVVYPITTFCSISTFIYYWAMPFQSYPNRTIAIILIGTTIFTFIHFCLNRFEIN